MSQTTDLKFSNLVLLVPLSSTLILWTVLLVELRLGINLNHFGVYPRTISGLLGIFFSPFIHASIEHLYNNTIPFAVLLASLFYFYRSISWKVVGYGLLLSGVLTWIIGRPSYHIGASGMIYMLASFIFFKGVFSRHIRLIALSLFVVFVYGSMLWYIFPIQEGISWEGHLSGFLSGLFLVYMVDTVIPSEKKYEWEKEDYDEKEDEFLRHFDKDGNFIDEFGGDDQDETIRVTYHYRENDGE
ncbi:MAG: rhomboid family intramembrane serine protease [Bacteroidota bacterium]